MKENENKIEQFIKMWINVANRVAVTIRREPFEKGADKPRPLKHFPCPQIWQRIVVWWDGEVFMCCGDWHGEYKLGNARETSLYELWHCEKYNLARELHAKGKFNEIPICARCEVNTPLVDKELERLKNNYGGVEERKKVRRKGS